MCRHRRPWRGQTGGRRRDEQQLQRRVEHHAVRDRDVRAIGRKRAVQRCERARVDVDMLAEQSLHVRRIARDCLRQGAEAHPIRKIGRAREGRHEAAVHEDEPVRRIGIQERVEPAGFESRRGGRRDQVRTGNLRHARKPPLLVADGRESKLRETRGSPVPDLLQPAWSSRRALFEHRCPRLMFLGYLCHVSFSAPHFQLPAFRYQLSAAQPARSRLLLSESDSPEAELAAEARSGGFDPAVTLTLQLQRQLLAAGLDDPSGAQHVHEVGHDVVEQPLIVSHHDDGALG